MLIDRFAVFRWMNSRKLTPPQLAALSETEPQVIHAMLADERREVEPAIVAALADALRVSPAQLEASAELPCAVTMNASELYDTCRPIWRDGIHFYNYYSMASAPDRVGPVILDILCPSDHAPALNNGHLEPAMTLNIGPGDINGRWGEQMEGDCWHQLAVNRGDDAWIVGDSYLEPSYCPHAYSLASDVPARIISYTGTSNLAPIVEALNALSDRQADAIIRSFGDSTPAEVLAGMLAARGFDPEQAARAANLPPDLVRRAVENDEIALGPDDLRRLGEAIGFDYRIVLPPSRLYDSIGKSVCSVGQSRAGRRLFRGYMFASMANAPHLSNLTGTFIQCQRARASNDLDLVGYTDTHYFVSSGELVLDWIDKDGARRSAPLERDGTAWLAPGVEHGWSGEGALARFTSGAHYGYLDWLELSNTYAAGATMKRARGDATGWGYEEG